MRNAVQWFILLAGHIFSLCCPCCSCSAYACQRCNCNVASQATTGGALQQQGQGMRVDGPRMRMRVDRACMPLQGDPFMVQESTWSGRSCCRPLWDTM